MEPPIFARICCKKYKVFLKYVWNFGLSDLLQNMGKVRRTDMKQREAKNVVISSQMNAFGTSHDKVHLSFCPNMSFMNECC